MNTEMFPKKALKSATISHLESGDIVVSTKRYVEIRYTETLVDVPANALMLYMSQVQDIAKKCIVAEDDLRKHQNDAKLILNGNNTLTCVSTDGYVCLVREIPLLNVNLPKEQSEDNNLFAIHGDVFSFFENVDEKDALKKVALWKAKDEDVFHLYIPHKKVSMKWDATSVPNYESLIPDTDVEIVYLMDRNVLKKEGKEVRDGNATIPNLIYISKEEKGVIEWNAEFDKMYVSKYVIEDIFKKTGAEIIKIKSFHNRSLVMGASDKKEFTHILFTHFLNLNPSPNE